MCSPEVKKKSCKNTILVPRDKKSQASQSIKCIQLNWIKSFLGCIFHSEQRTSMHVLLFTCMHEVFALVFYASIKVTQCMRVPIAQLVSTYERTAKINKFTCKIMNNNSCLSLTPVLVHGIRNPCAELSAKCACMSATLCNCNCN